MNHNPRVEVYIEAVSFRRIATVEQLQLEYTAADTHTHSQLYATPRGIIIWAGNLMSW